MCACVPVYICDMCVLVRFVVGRLLLKLSKRKKVTLVN